MTFSRNTITRIGLAVALCLPLALTQAARGQRGGRGMMAGDPRVQNRTYIFPDTNEPLPYAVFVSSKVTPDKKAPLIMALRGAGGNPTVFLRGAALDLAEEGGYILVGAMGYSPMGSYGMPASSFGRRGGAPGAASQTRPGGEAPRGARRAGSGPATTDAAKISEYSEKDVMNVLRMVREEFNVDDNRIYLVGHSQGGAGALHLGGKYASIWAAVAGLAPGAPSFQFDTNSKVKELPLLIMVGANDNLIASVQRLDEQMKSANIAHEYKEVPGLDHGGIIMGALPDVFRFFGEHSKPELPESEPTASL